MTKSDDPILVRLANRVGVIGLLMLVVPSLLAAWVYQGDADESFSFLTHTLSELGRYDTSTLAVLVNGGLFFGGLALVLCFSSQAWIRRDAPLTVSLHISGVLLALSVAACGLFPVNVGPLHSKAMTAFYLMTPICAVIYCFAILTELPPRWGVLPAMAAAGCALLLLLDPERDLMLMDRYAFGQFGAERPAIWWPALTGWLLLLFVGIWLLYVLVLVRRQQ
ncbi:hypothetical protein [Ferrimonas marina]|uniref:DUF998 domain-containing protein n=1 Tax=Ferrimonas marina TaxID=299255 RepID=A0A1M5YGC7_9GAMM|nr:hypothetical protein [Ferrimonas marina]SHI11097.1 hypothetical protein SAMN02745129_4217 [Ferrimonas marina]